MGSTTRFALRYPEPGDEVDIPVDMQELALDTDGRLSRAFECTSSTRPTGVPSGFIIRETDTGAWLGYDGTTWVTLGGAAGGGSTASYRARATSAQNVATGSVVTGFGDEPDPDALVTRSTHLAGHKFTLNGSGIWAVKAAVRIASSATPGEVSLDLIELAGDRSLDLDGGKREGLPRSLSVSACEYLPSGTQVFAKLFNGTGAQRVTEPNGGNWVHFSAALVA